MITGCTRSRIVFTATILASFFASNLCNSSALGLEAGVGAEVRIIRTNTKIDQLSDLEKSPARTDARLTARDGQDIKKLARFSQLKNLVLSCYGDIDLAPLASLKNLERVDLRLLNRTASAPQSVKFLASLPHLRALNLYMSAGYDTAPRAQDLTLIIPSLPGLNSMSLTSSNDCTFAPGSDYRNLRTFEIGAPLKTQSVFRAMPALTSLTFGGTFQISREGNESLKSCTLLSQFTGPVTKFTPLPAWTRLKSLEATCNIDAVDNIAAAKSLQHLTLSLPAATDEKLKPLGTLPSLSFLDLKITPHFADGRMVASRACSGRSLGGQGRFSKLQTLRIDGLPVSDELMNAISSIHTLRSLKIADDGNDLSIKQAQLLNRLSNLTEADLPWPRKNMIATLRECRNLSHLTTLNLSNQELTDQDISILAKFSEIKVLELANNQLTDNCFKTLSKLTRLSDLNLASNRLSGKGLNQLLNVPLQSLNLSNNPLTDGALAQLSANHTSLQSLDLSDTQVKGDSFKALSTAFPSLRALALSGTEVDDVSIAGLVTPNLNVISVEQTEVTEHGIETLARLPKLRQVIAFNSGIKFGAVLPPRLAVSYQTGWKQIDFDSAKSDTAYPANAADRRPASKPLLAESEARQYYINGDYKNAISKYNLAIQSLTHPDEFVCSYAAEEHSKHLFNCYDGRAMALAAIGNFDKALLDLNRAREITRSSAIAHAHRGHVLAKLGRNDEAMKAVNRAIEIKPELAEAYEYRAAIYRALQQPALALNDHRHALQLQQSNPVVNTSIAKKSAVVPL